MAEIGLNEAFSAMDRNQPQTPRRPRTQGVGGSNQLVGFAYRWREEAELLAKLASAQKATDRGERSVEPLWAFADAR